MIERIAFPVRVSLLLAIGVLLIGGALAFARSAHAAKPAPRTQISQPIIGCDNAVTTQTSLGIEVCAGATGLPAGLVVPPVGAGFLTPSATSGLVTTLTDYNEGAIGPGHCE